MALAVTTWSPVIMTGLMPARRHCLTASRASGRGGSIMPTRPRKVRLFSSASEVTALGSPSRTLYPTARTRSAWRLISSLTRRAAARSPEMHRPSMTSKAPFTMATILPSMRLTVVMSLRSESKGRSARRGDCALSASFSMPFLCAATMMAVSVGSPMCFSPSGEKSTEPSQHRAAYCSRRRTGAELLSEMASVPAPPST